MRMSSLLILLASNSFYMMNAFYSGTKKFLSVIGAAIRSAVEFMFNSSNKRWTTKLSVSKGSYLQVFTLRFRALKRAVPQQRIAPASTHPRAPRRTLHSHPQPQPHLTRPTAPPHPLTALGAHFFCHRAQRRWVFLICGRKSARTPLANSRYGIISPIPFSHAR